MIGLTDQVWVVLMSIGTDSDICLVSCNTAAADDEEIPQSKNAVSTNIKQNTYIHLMLNFS